MPRWCSGGAMRADRPDWCVPVFIYVRAFVQLAE